MLNAEDRRPSLSAMADGTDHWRDKLDAIMATMRELSKQRDPQEMVRTYGDRMQQILPRDRIITLSRRDLVEPLVRITRDSARTEQIDPWREKDKLPLIRGGLFSELIYGDMPYITGELAVDADDPAYDYLSAFKSLMAIPLFDDGVAKNMVLFLKHDAAAFQAEQLPETVWVSNLFGRATHNLVLGRQIAEAYEQIDRELQAVGDIQRSLLPSELPKIRGLDLAAYYQTSRRAGGDYYDFFPMTDGRWGMLIADVSGHGTPAAVVMAITHALAHTQPDCPCAPQDFLYRLNEKLTRDYTGNGHGFVTAFYAAYDPEEKTLQYASAGHNPPRLKRCADGTVAVLNRAGGLPLGITEEAEYEEAVYELQRGDQLIFYTDGITEAFNHHGEMFGAERLDLVLENCSVNASSLMDALIAAVDEFVEGRPIEDDQTIVIARVTE